MTSDEIASVVWLARPQKAVLAGSTIPASRYLRVQTKKFAFALGAERQASGRRGKASI